MKRIIIAISILLLAAVAFLLFKKDLNHSGNVGVKDFLIEHPEMITKIHYASNNKEEGFLTFTKDASQNWWVENGKNKYKVDTSSLKDLLFYVLAKVEVKTPVNDSSLNRVNRDMAISATLVQLYEGNKLIRKFYAGSRTPDDLGTYMYLPGAERPCITHIPGHDGYLSPYFTVNINNWRSPVIFEANASEIRTLEIKWNEAPQNGFSIQKQGDELGLSDYSGKEVPASRNRILSYLDMFSGITRETGDLPGINRSLERDSILRSTPFFEINAVLTNGEKRGLKLYHRKVSTETYSPEDKIGQLKIYETETYWGVASGSDEIWLMQDAILHKNMKTLQQMLESKITQ